MGRAVLVGNLHLDEARDRAVALEDPGELAGGREHHEVADGEVVVGCRRDASLAVGRAHEGEASIDAGDACRDVVVAERGDLGATCIVEADRLE